MSDKKRPWTPWPWEMAKLLKEMVEKHDFITEHIGPTELSEHIHRARQLLKEIGYV